jgi:LysR family nitrogen assimilation transcriptional regulator
MGEQHTDPDAVNLQALECFVQISELGSFSKASAVVNISQPTLSRYIQQLERQLGTRLFGRTGRGVVLTEAGDTLLRHSRTILRQAQQAYAEVSDIGNTPSGTVVLGLAPIARKVLGVRVATEFIKAAPTARLQIEEYFTGFVQEWLSRGRIDVGILYDDGMNTSLDGEILWEEEYILIGRRDARWAQREVVPFRDIASIPLVLPSGPHGLRTQIDRCTIATGTVLDIVHEVDGLNAILALVREGVGATILTPPALQDFYPIEDLVARRIVEPRITSTVVAVPCRSRPMTNASSRLLRIIREEARRIRASDTLNRLPQP